jgi:uncharacterized protein (DUF885 family)
MQMKIAVLTITALMLTSTTMAAPKQPFAILLDDHWAWVMKNSPVFATTLGERRYDDQLGELTVASLDQQTVEAEALIKRLQAINPQSLSEADKLNHAILLRDLKEGAQANGFPQRLMLFTNRSGWHSNFAGMPDDVPLYTYADYKSYVARLKAYPKLNAEGIATTRQAIAAEMIQSCEPMKGFETSISSHIVSDVEKSVFWQPFKKKPDAISDTNWATLMADAKSAIMKDVVPAYQAFYDVYVKEYQPKCRASFAVSDMPKGADYYAYRVRTQTTTDLTPAQIHKIGLDEVARIRSEMEAVVKRAGFAGTRAEYVAKLRTDPQYYAKTPEELMQRTGALMKYIDGEMPKYFGRLPRLPYTVKPIPDASAPGNTTAYYEGGAAETGRAGVYRVNTTELNQRPLFELPALSLHEAVPGHHHQIALQQELTLPKFRKHVTFFTAFVEGWGLYSERIGIEMGLYDTPEKDFGRLSYEMWRACRLVVDTGIHSMGWSRDQAIAYMLDNTALSKANIEAEVNRYITWPGQALAYKIGELKIRELRAKAEKRLGRNFDLRRFHDAVLENGAVPLSVLEDHINRWIPTQEKTR